MKLKRERTASRSRPARLPPSEPSGARPLPDSGPYAQVRCCLREAPAQEGAETSPPRRRGRAGPDRTAPSHRRRQPEPGGAGVASAPAPAARQQSPAFGRLRAPPATLGRFRRRGYIRGSRRARRRRRLLAARVLAAPCPSPLPA